MGSFSSRVQLAATLAVIIAAPAAMALAASPQSGQAAVLFDPRLERAELLRQIAETDARLVRFGAAPGLAIVELPADGPSALRRAGAWLIADPLLLGGCAPAASPDITRG